MQEIKVQAPAKINITLDVINKRDDGYHDIKSIMHAISLYDYLTVKTEDCSDLTIEITGNSDEIPYDENNLIWKAAEKFFQAAGISGAKLSVYLEKNIPVQAGLAGGSSDAAATVFALNNLYNSVLKDTKIHEICASLGSDLNFCLIGGCAVCSSRGESVRRLPFLELPVSIVKPRYLKISAKEAFQEFDFLTDVKCINSSDALIPLILRGSFDNSLMHNDLELPLRKKYNHINNLKKYMNHSMMSGSGPVFYEFVNQFDILFDKDEFIVEENLRTIKDGVKIIN